MSEPFIGEIRMFGFDWSPQKWALCNGQELQITDNQTLYALIGTLYGGDGRVTFKLPNLMGRVPISYDNSAAIPIGQIGGIEDVTLNIQEMPAHTHNVTAVDQPSNRQKIGENRNRFLGQAPIYHSASLNAAATNPLTCTSTGGNQAHDNIQPSLVVNFCIALEGIFPSRN